VNYEPPSSPPQLLAVPTSGVQALLPNYSFNTPGLLKEIAVSCYGESILELQVWKPLSRGVFVKKWSQLYDSAGFRRVAIDTVQWSSISGIPISPGDIIGFFIKGSMHIVNSTGLHYKMYYASSDQSLCSLSLCDNHIKELQSTAPSIAITKFGQFKSINTVN